ncbi:MAG TPA: hypothetical protein VK793_03525 [Steroidobacteraceae bacterium]|nr:hypothetical protein [Steroidobacteraceae bacterium]
MTVLRFSKRIVFSARNPPTPKPPVEHELSAVQPGGDIKEFRQSL